MSSDNKNNVVWVDIMKGNLILLMVLGHTYVAYKEFIYLFHMSVFFMISGYCWSEKHSKNTGTVKNYLVQRIIRLYVPFVLINVAYILLNNFFISIGFYSDSQDFTELTSGSPYIQQVTEYYSFSQIFKSILRTLCFAGGSAKMCGPTWFLATLFMISVFHCILEWIIRKFKWNKVKTMLIAIIICFVCAWIFDRGIISTFGAIERFPAAYVAYIMGILIRMMSKTEKNNSILKRKTVFTIAFFLSLVVLVLLYLVGFHVELARAEITNIIGYVIASICGWIFIKGLAIFISRFKLSTKLFCFLGTRTMPILLFHTISFKIVSLFYIKITNESMLLLASYPVVFTTNEWIKYLYLALGIIVPVIIYHAYFVGRNNVVKLIKNS